MIKFGNSATMKQMCETICKSEILENKDGTKPMPEQIYNYSSTGELFKIWDWYEYACNALKTNSIITSP